MEPEDELQIFNPILFPIAISFEDETFIRGVECNNPDFYFWFNI